MGDEGYYTFVPFPAAAWQPRLEREVAVCSSFATLLYCHLYFPLAVAMLYVPISQDVFHLPATGSASATVMCPMSMPNEHANGLVILN